MSAYEDDAPEFGARLIDETLHGVTLSDDELREIADDARAWGGEHGGSFAHFSPADLPYRDDRAYAEGVVAERKRQRSNIVTAGRWSMDDFGGGDVMTITARHRDGGTMVLPVGRKSESPSGDKERFVRELVDAANRGDATSPMPAKSSRAYELVIADLREIGGELARLVVNLGHSEQCMQANDELRDAVVGLPPHERTDHDFDYRCQCGLTATLDRAREKGLIK